MLFLAESTALLPTSPPWCGGAVPLATLLAGAEGVSPAMLAASLGAALVLALIHVFARRLRFLEVIPRSRWLSMAGGASVAYVFLHLLPEIASGVELVDERVDLWGGLNQLSTWLVAMVGLVSFYGLERAAMKDRAEGGNPSEEDYEEEPTTPPVFWLHIGSFGLYNVIIGYLLLHLEEGDLAALGLFSLAMALHFVVNDYGLREHHKELYRRWGRWLLAAAVLGGAVMGLLVEVRELYVSVLIAFLGGGVVLNVLKEELPAERESRFWAFTLGAAVYAVLMVLMA